jgi:Fic family protein
VQLGLKVYKEFKLTASLSFGDDEVYEKPPYTITEKAADNLAKIVEIVTRLEFGTDFKRDIKLHRKNRVSTIYTSLAIEGNTLSLNEVTAVIEGKAVAGKQAEIKEDKNAYEAYGDSDTKPE